MSTIRFLKEMSMFGITSREATVHLWNSLATAYHSILQTTYPKWSITRRQPYRNSCFHDPCAMTPGTVAGQVASSNSSRSSTEIRANIPVELLLFFRKMVHSTLKMAPLVLAANSLQSAEHGEKRYIVSLTQILSILGGCKLHPMGQPKGTSLQHSTLARKSLQLRGKKQTSPPRDQCLSEREGTECGNQLLKHNSLGALSEEPTGGWHEGGTDSQEDQDSIQTMHGQVC